LQTLAVEDLAVALVLGGFGEGADIDEVVDGHFGFVAFCVCFELLRFDLDGDFELAVGEFP